MTSEEQTGSGCTVERRRRRPPLLRRLPTALSLCLASSLPAVAGSESEPESATAPSELPHYLMPITTISPFSVLGMTPDAPRLHWGVYTPQLLEAQLAPHFGVDFADGKWFVYAIPRVDLRMALDSVRSHPVAPPSYRPSAGFLWRALQWNEAQDSLLIGVELAHHSNGRGILKGADAVERVEAPFGSATGDSHLIWIEPDRTAKVLEGSNFGLNHVIFTAWFEADDTASNIAEGIRSLTSLQQPLRQRQLELIGLRYDWTPPWLGTEPGLWNTYGLWRPGVEISGLGPPLLPLSRDESRQREVRVITRLDVILGDIIMRPLIEGSPDILKRPIVETTFVHRHPKVDDFSVFFRAYLGQDYMNHYFDSQVAAVSVGLALDSTPFRRP